MLTASQRNAIRKIAKQEFKIKGSVWVNVFPITSTQFLISYVDRLTDIEHNEMLML